MKSFKIYLNNVRGIKSKEASYNEIIEHVNPHIIGLVETHLGKEVIETNGYSYIYNNNKKGKGGIAIGVKSNMLHLIKELKRSTKEYETMWIIISNNKVKIRIGILYAPQETVNKSAIESMYNEITEQRMEAEKEKEIFLVMGDFNCKIGKKIKGNNPKISKYGNNLINLTKENKLRILNCHKACKGIWTRIEGNQKSVIDYIMVGKENEKNIKEITIDEGKHITPFHIVNNRTIYSDHCAIVCEANWYIESKDTEKTLKIINKKSLEKFKQKTNKGELTKIANSKGSIKYIYKRWQSQINKIIKENISEKNIKKEKYQTKKIRKLYKLKREIKIKYLKENFKLELYQIQNEIIKKCIREEERKNKKELINKEISRIEKEGGMASEAFWKFKKRMDNKIKQNEIANGMKNKNNVLITDNEEIKGIFSEFYENLFKVEDNDTQATTWNKHMMTMIEKLSTFESEQTQQEYTKDEIQEKIKSLKKKRTNDTQGWNNILIKNAGEDVINSIAILFKKIDKQSKIPDEWEEIIIKSIYKNKGEKSDMENRRGLFMTSVISKLYEKVKFDRNSTKINEGTNKYQCGGVKGKSTIDHIITLNEIINYNKYLNKETYILFADAYKCFDKLNLENCIIDLYEIVGAKEAIKIYRLNEKGRAKIHTPIGETNMIKANNIVRQGTLAGPKLCGINTGKVNENGRKCITKIGQKTNIEMCTFVDDINYATSEKNQLCKAVENLKMMEKQKGYTFNIGKEKTAILIVNKKKNKKYEIDVKVKKGNIEITNEYKYLGEWYDEKGSHATSIKMRRKKVQLYITQTKVYGNENIIGKYALTTRIKIYKTVVRPTIFHNIEGWSIINKKNIEELENIQANILKKVCDMRVTTSYLGLLSELDIWPVKKHIEYKKLILFHNIITSKNNRALKEIIEDELEYTWPGCWIESIKLICNEYKINIEEIKNYSKQKLKNQLKEIIKEQLNAEIKDMTKNKTKLRFIKEFSTKTYLKKLEYQDSIIMLKTRLNMIEVKHNFKSLFAENLKCNICNMEDTTEHLLNCISKSGLTEEDIITQNKEVVNIIKTNIKERKKQGYIVTI